MKVLKFGGTSVGSAARMKEVAKLIRGERNVVVLSAMSGATNALVEIADYVQRGNPDGAAEAMNALRERHRQQAVELLREPAATLAVIDGIFAAMPSGTAEILAQGELLSTAMMNALMLEQGVRSVLLPALDFMKTDERGEPDTLYIKEKLSKMLDEHPEAELFITQGFICRNFLGEVDNLQRGGSDYTASLAGAAVGASEIQIWTDIDGMHNNDPREVQGTKPVRNLHFEEAAELAYFGAKILHPTCILPAKLAGIPVRLLNTMEPSAPGTLISNHLEKGRIEAVAAKEGITAIKIKSGRMLLATGFLRRVFEVFEKFQTPIDMITTSEVGVSVTIDNDRRLAEIEAELKTFGTVTVEPDMVIICVVGDLEWENVGFEARAVEALHDIPVRMISYGGSNFNISLLVRIEDKKRALQALSDKLFK